MELLNEKIINTVSKWDLNKQKANEKTEILTKWERDINDDETFLILLKICEHFNYYSENKTAETFFALYNKLEITQKEFDLFFEESIFMPLRRKERTETSIQMFVNFMAANNIDAIKTNMDGPLLYLSKYFEEKEVLHKNIKKFLQLKEENQSKVEKLEERKQENAKDLKTHRKIGKEQRKYEAEIVREKERLKRTLAVVKSKYLDTKNLIIIDDFIGTGDSMMKFFKDCINLIKVLEVKIYIIVLETSLDGEETILGFAQHNQIDVTIMSGNYSKDVLEKDYIFEKSNVTQVSQKIELLNKKFKINKNIYCKNHAIATYVNAPNNNLTLLSSKSKTWHPIFLRKKKNEKKIKEIKDEDFKDYIKSQYEK